MTIRQIADSLSVSKSQIYRTLHTGGSEDTDNKRVPLGRPKKLDKRIGDKILRASVKTHF